MSDLFTCSKQYNFVSTENNEYLINYEYGLFDVFNELLIIDCIRVTRTIDVCLNC